MLWPIAIAWAVRVFRRHTRFELLVLNQERLSPEAKMLQDMMTIVHGSSSRLDRLRNYRRQLDATLKQDAKHAAGPSHQA